MPSGTADVTAGPFRTRMFSICAYLLCSVACGFADDEGVITPKRYGRQLRPAECAPALESLALHMRSNFEKIKTWRSAYGFIDCHRWPRAFPSDSDQFTPKQSADDQLLEELQIRTGKDSGPGYWIINTGDFHFSLNTTEDNYHLFYNVTGPTVLVDSATGAQGLWEEVETSTQWIVTPETSLRFPMHRRTGQLPDFPKLATVPRTGGRIIYREVPSHGTGYWVFVDPREFFQFGTSLWYWKFCQLRAEALRRLAGAEATDGADKGERVYVTDASPPVYTYAFDSDNVSYLLVFDGNAGFNVVKSIQTSEMEVQRTIEYRSVSGVLIPQRYEYRRIEEMEGNSVLRYVRVFTLQDASLNAEIPELEFDVKQLELKYGERMLDEIKNQLFVWNGTEFVPADDFVPDPARLPNDERTPIATAPPPVAARPQPQGLRWLLIINGVVIAIAIGWYLLSRRRSNKK